MIAHYELACNIDIMGNPRITASKGRFSSGDPRVQRILRAYPGVSLSSVTPDPPPAKLTADLFGPVPQQSSVRTVAGLQIGERRPTKWDE
jgi:hypothetical protein